MSSPLIFDQVSKLYAGVHALDRLSFQLGSGEVVGILGHNGAGKTTCMKLALGIIKPSHGEITVMGDNPRGRKSEQLRRKIGYLPENVSFYQQLTGREVLKYFSSLKGAQDDSVEDLLRKVGLGQAADRRIRTYSKGMRQRVGLAQALLGNPRLLFLDEPTAGLDPQATREFYQLIDNLRSEGVSILISSHVLPGVERHIDRAIIMSHGQLRAQGSLEDLRREAGLPLIIQVSSDVESDLNIPVGDLERANYRISHRNGVSLHIEGPPENKMEAIRLLVNSGAVQDLEVVQPTLESLYAHFNPPVEEVAQ